ncbi:MAG: hypothetical protein ACI8WB_005610, partial [Phenylobacterium sp.]
MVRIAKQLHSLIALPDSLSALTDAQWHTLVSYGHSNMFDSAGVISRVMSEAVGEHSANDFGIVVILAGHLNAPIKNIDSNYYPGQVLIADSMTGTIRIDANSHILRLNGQALTRLERENAQVAEAFYALVNQQQRERVLIKRLEQHFGELSESNKNLILSECEWQTLPQGAQLAAAGESCNHWYMVIDGKLQGFFPASEDSNKADRQWLSGDLLGHRSLLSTGEHRATILAATDVRLAVFNRATFDSLWQQDHFKSV